MNERPGENSLEQEKASVLELYAKLVELINNKHLPPVGGQIHLVNGCLTTIFRKEELQF